MQSLSRKGRNQYSLVSTGIGNEQTVLISKYTMLLKRVSQTTDKGEPALILQEKWPHRG